MNTNANIALLNTASGPTPHGTDRRDREQVQHQLAQKSCHVRLERGDPAAPANHTDKQPLDQRRAYGCS
jgi:hypothetical protein